MSKVAVLYRSKYGTARQYAEWIAEETGGDLFRLPHVSVTQLETYDTIITGGGLYASGILGFSFFRKHFSALRGKKLIVFSVGASHNNETNRAAIRQHNLTPEMQEQVQYFHLRGGLDYPGMGWLDRTVMGLLVASLKKKPEREMDDEIRGMIACYGKKVSFLDRNSIAPILAAARS